MPTLIEWIGERIWYPFSWIAISVAILAMDFTFGPVIQFQALFVVPVGLAAWANGRWWGLGLAITLSLVRLYFTTVLDPPWTPAVSILNAAIRIAVLGSFAVLVDRVRHMLTLAREVEILRGLLPICNFCKKIKDQQDVWQPSEGYISTRSAAEFKDAVCPECVRKHYPETFDRR